jgi:hypothetical protein
MTFRREGIHPLTWPDIFALLKPAIDHGGDTDAHELIDQLLADRAQLWVKRSNGWPVAAAVTTIHHDRTLNCQLLGGSNVRTWMDELIAHVAEECRPLGIQKFVETGRKGWLRFLGRKGWVEAGRDGHKVIMELAL